MSDTITVSERPGGKYTNDVRSSRHHLYADEPVRLGGADLGPTPYEFLCAALGACTSITMRMYADRKKWPIKDIKVDVTHKKQTDEDGVTTDLFQRVILITCDLKQAQRDRLIEIANKCPVHRTLEGGSHVVTTVTN